LLFISREKPEISENLSSPENRKEIEKFSRKNKVDFILKKINDSFRPFGPCGEQIS
jgi:hypothetical protein